MTLSSITEITNSKLRNSAALSVIGNSTNASADPADIAAGTDGFVLRRSGTTLGFGQIVAAGIADANVTTAKIANGSVTAVKLGSDIFLVPPGAVMAFAMNSVPAGWLAANGTAVSRTTYATLFAAIGTLYGTGNGSTTFTLPDLRGYFVRGAGTNTDGSASGSFGAKQADEFEAHSHTVKEGEDGGSEDDTPKRLTSGDDFTENVHAYQTSSITGGTETRPKNIAMLYCIKF